MSSRTRTVGVFFTGTMAAMLLGALLQAQSSRPDAAVQASESAAPVISRSGGPGLGLDTFRNIAKATTDGVVNISTRKTISKRKGNYHDWSEDLMDRFFGPGGGDGEGGGNANRTQRSLGSGFVYEESGWILTNRHVVEGADQISVSFPDGRQYEAKLKGMDSRTDVALLKIEPKEKLVTLRLGDSDQTEVGEWVAAMGNPFGLGGNSMTVGVVSYKGRPLTLGTRGTSVDMIQTDAAINPGNSGGPLLNARGEVVGINTLIITQGSAQSAGVGFAVPINAAKDILPQLRETGKVVRGWLGVQIQTVTEDLAKTLKKKDPGGAMVSEVSKGSPAEKAGIKDEDVVVAVDGRPVKDNGDLSRYIASKAPATTVKLEIFRDGSTRTVSVTLGTFPEETDKEEEQETAKAQLGMSLRDLSPAMADRLDLPRGTRGVVVTDVESGGAAEDAGLQRGDLIVSVNGSPVETVDAFEQVIEKVKDDGVARLRIRRGGSHALLTLRLR